MKLSAPDQTLFFKLRLALLHYVNQHTQAVEGVSTYSQFGHLPFLDKVAIRDSLNDHPELIDPFVEENPARFSVQELAIVVGWKTMVVGNFFVVRYLKKHAIFLEEGELSIAYGVNALGDGFEDTIGTDLPRYIRTVLLPFKGRIVYDGIITATNVHFGPGYRQSISDVYQEARFRFGVVTSLPFSPESEGRSDADRLRYYLKSERNRDRYWDEIVDMIEEDPDLLALYHQELGKIRARGFRKQLREMRIGEAWFAVLEELVIGSGPTRAALLESVEQIVPADRLAHVHVFRHR